LAYYDQPPIGSSYPIQIFLDTMSHYKVWKAVTLECAMWLENNMLLGSLTYLALWVGAWSEKVTFSSSPTPWYVILHVWYLRGGNGNCSHKILLNE
jgi:hypothetical protein